MNKNKNKKSDYLYKMLGIGLVLVIGIVGYFVSYNQRQEELLKKEIISVAKQDLLIDNYDIKIKTKGDYAYIEKKVKEYFKDLSEHSKKIYSYVRDERLIKILSATNLEDDGPNFDESFKLLSEVRNNSMESLKVITNLCSEKTIKDLVDKDKISKKKYKLYLKLMYTDDDLEKLEITEREIQEFSDNLNSFLDKVEHIFEMLKNNKDYWFIKDGQLYFETNKLVDEYNELYNDLNDFVEDKFSKYRNLNIGGKTDV